MSTPFDPQRGLVVVRARLWGPGGDTDVRLGLDTGATATVIRTAILVSLGYDPVLAPERLQMTTGSGLEYVPRLAIDRIEALERARTNFGVIGHSLPPTATVDGLLGLDFLRGRRLTVDFAKV
jgi:hypothetical protein